MTARTLRIAAGIEARAAQLGMTPLMLAARMIEECTVEAQPEPQPVGAATEPPQRPLRAENRY
ncbi:hypothetical protein BA190_09250 [Labrys sp. WJW]|nr:hypothetical protein BA190_09250 [Labrys sp. WJW]